MNRENTKAKLRKKRAVSTIGLFAVLGAVLIVAGVALVACGGGEDEGPAAERAEPTAVTGEVARPTEKELDLAKGGRAVAPISQHTPTPVARVVDNFDAAFKLKEGMTRAEVDGMMGPESLWTLLRLRAWAEGDEVKLEPKLADGSILALTPEDAGPESPYYAYLFFPSLLSETPSAGERAPTYVIFDAADDTIVARKNWLCEETLDILEIGGQTHEFHETSACRPGAATGG